MKTSFSLLILTICLLYSISSLHIKHHQKNNAIDNKNIFLKDSYNYFVTGNNNQVWAGALTLAWQQLNNNIIKQKVKVASSNKLVNKIVQNFNTCPFTKDALSSQSYYIKSGYGQQTITTINTEVINKFPNKTTSPLDMQLSDHDIISYAYLSKTFQYPIKFTKDDNFKFKNQIISGFRASNNEQKKQVKYSYYKSPQDFLIKLETKNQNQGLYLLRTNDKQNIKVKDIINKVNQYSQKTMNQLNQLDMFAMPIIDLDYYREVHQLENVAIKNKGFQDYQINKAFEALKLKIDQTGVKVENEGAILMVRSSLPIGESKKFILNDTFWVILKQQNKHPYLCVKINKPTDKQQL